MLYTYLAVEATYPFEKRALFIEIRVFKGQLASPKHFQPKYDKYSTSVSATGNAARNTTGNAARNATGNAE